MTRFARLRTGPFRILLVLALVALAIRAAVPAGFMLSADRDRWIAITLCSGAGPMQMALNLETGEHHDGASAPFHDDQDDQAAHDAPCVFATAATPTPPIAASISLPVRAFSAEAPRVFPASVAVGQGLAAPPPWATGPPIRL
jgi:hypothetical protein